MDQLKFYQRSEKYSYEEGVLDKQSLGFVNGMSTEIYFKI